MLPGERPQDRHLDAEELLALAVLPRPGFEEPLREFRRGGRGEGLQLQPDLFGAHRDVPLMGGSVT